MKMQYDKTANNKPANAGRLYFNNAGFRQQQDNIYNHENAQKLDISALSAQEEVSGTECVGLLIEHWKDVAGAGDKFRDFGTGVLNSALTRQLKSNIDTDQANADSIGVDSKVFEAPKFNTNPNVKATLGSGILDFILPTVKPPIPPQITPFDMFLSGLVQTVSDEADFLARGELGINVDDVFDVLKMIFLPYTIHKPRVIVGTDPFDESGLYGGNQAFIDQAVNVFRSGWIVGENDEIYDFVRSHKGYENYSDKEIHDLLNELEHTGCTYVAATNAIFWQYRNMGDLFEEKLGFPITGDDGDLNYKKLIIDYYINTNHRFFLDVPDGKDLFAEYYSSNFDEFKTTYNDYLKFDNNGNAMFGELKDEQDVIEAVYYKLMEEGKTEVITKIDKTGSGYFASRFKHYSKEKKLGIKIVGEDAVIDETSIREALERGCNVEIEVDDFELEYADGSKYELGADIDAHGMIITGIEPDGRYIVSTWGKKYYLNPNNKNMKDIKLHYIRLVPSVDQLCEYRDALNELSVKDDKGFYSVFFKNEIDNTIRRLNDELTERTNIFKEDHKNGPNPEAVKEEYYEKLKYKDPSTISKFQKHPQYKDITIETMNGILDEIEKNGEECAVDVNLIMNMFKGKPREFEKAFGYPMIDEDNICNTNELFLDYCLTNNIGLEDDMTTNATSASKRLSKFFESKGLDHKTELKSMGDEPKPEDINKALEQGYFVSFDCYKSSLLGVYNEQKKESDGEGEDPIITLDDMLSEDSSARKATIVGIAKNGDYLVSYRGEIRDFNLSNVTYAEFCRNFQAEKINI